MEQYIHQTQEIFLSTLNIKKIKQVIMGLLDKAVQPTKKQDDTLTPQEIEFIMKKMRSATYVGDEFELFYTVFVKLSKELDQVKK